MEVWENTYDITATSGSYDWRLDYEELTTKGRVLSNGYISYLVPPAEGTAPHLIQKLRDLAQHSKTGKVTIIAHSNGGLLAKALLRNLGDTEAAQLVDTLILVASPQLGTPDAVGVLLHGANGGIPNALSDEKAREVANTMPAAYNMLPSLNYFTHVDDPVITFDASTLPEWASHYGQTIHSRETMENFLGDATRAKPAYADLATPEVMQAALLENSHNAHIALDEWTPPSGVRLVTIAGWGEETLAGIDYRGVRRCSRVESVVLLGRTNYYCGAWTQALTFNPRHVIDGDGTVVEASAHWQNGVSGERWWVDLEDYNVWWRSNLDRRHASIFEVPTLRSLLKNILTESDSPLQYISNIAPTDEDNSPRLHFTLHSPLTLEFTDTLGRHIGPSTSTPDAVDYEVPGAYYEHYGEVQWLSLPKEATGTLVMRGKNAGSFTLDIAEQNGNTTTATTSFGEVLSVTSTIATIAINPENSVTASSTLEVDTDGNGIIDIVLHAEENGTVIAPVSKFPLTITPNNKTIILGTSIPLLTAIPSGFIDGDTASTTVTGAPSCTTTAISGSPVGVYPITCTIGTLISDKYDFTTFTTGTLTILYKWSGFTQPINDTAHNPTQSMSVFKGGSTIPVKFQIKNASNVPVQASTVPLWLTPQKLSPMSASIDEFTYSDPATSGTTFRWDSMSRQYIYNWSTRGLTTGYWYRIYAKLEDGTIQSVVMGIR
jgi:pimeloyl-ACP methyl ester carboxylesterase